MKTSNLQYRILIYIVTNMTVARQRLGKHHLKAGGVELEWRSIASQRLAKHAFPLQRMDTDDPLLGNGSVSTFQGNGETE
jgi:hypothetical protein